MQSVFDAEQFANTIVNMAHSILQRGDDEAGVEAIREIQAFAEETSANHVDFNETIDCRAGCAHCCIVNVAVLKPEAEHVTDFLLQTRSEAELLDLYQELSRLDRETRTLDEEERIMARIKCAFLDSSGSCSIYPVRPLLCRSVTSTDAATCREALSMIALGEEIPIVANLVQKEIFEIAFSSFGEALRECGMESRSLRLATSVRNNLPARMKSQPDRSQHVN